MRLLIDGYNVMHAAGLMAPKFAPDQFRQARLRFLNDVADLLESDEAGKTTVVFDAASPPDHLPATTKHKGIVVIYAVDADDADERIEALVAGHSSPKKLTVVSSDLRLRQAATRRKASPMTAEAFLDELDRRRGRKRLRIGSEAHKVPKESGDRPSPSADPAESAFWKKKFAALDDDASVADAFREQSAMMCDEDLKRIAREVDAEGGGPLGRSGRPRS